MGSSTRSDDTDWHAYLEDKYGVSTIPRQYSARDMAKFIDSVVTLMFQQELYPTYRVLECIANNIPLEHKKSFWIWFAMAWNNPSFQSLICGRCSISLICRTSYNTPNATSCACCRFYPK